jgi:hypothetical protein
MKIQVVVPSEASLAQAGVRIRYQRIAGHLASVGHDLRITAIDDALTSDKFDADAYLFSKCYDARSYIVASVARSKGSLVGIDLFDDYFSQVADSRFLRQRAWLRTIARWCDFVLCSTSRMQEVASRSMPGVPAHVLNDPHAGLDTDRIAEAAEKNLGRAMSSRQIEVAWFGNGDNPHFPVGLKDVHAFAPVLHELRGAGMTPRLRLLTNRRALTANGLEVLGRLPIPWTVDEWSVDAERSLLEESLVAYIPVNAQPFSTAKSLNRAISALSCGVQVLSVGYPLYEPLQGLVYSEPASLLSDIVQKRLRLRRETLGILADRFATWADPRREAERLAAFVVETSRRRSPELPVGNRSSGFAVIHGVRSGVEVHELAQRHRQLSIGSPFSNEGLNYDVRLVAGPDSFRVAAELAERAVPRLRADLVSRLEPAVSRSGRPVRRLALDELFPRLSSPISRALAGRKSRLGVLATYAPAMAAEFDVVRSMFPGTEFVLSETEAPFGSSIDSSRPVSTSSLLGA